MRFITLLLFTLLATVISGQKEYKLSHSGGTLIMRGLDGATISAYDGSEIKIANPEHRDPEYKERARGLRVLNSLGLEDNTQMGLNVTQKDGDVELTQIGGKGCDCGESGYIIQVPRNMSIEYTHSKHSAETLTLEGISKEIIIAMSYGNVKLRDVTGPMSVKTVYGSIDAKFASVTSENTISLYSVYQHVDVSLPTATKADLSIKTPYGEIYTDLDIKVKSARKDGMSNISTKSVQGTLNGGGVSMSIKSGYDNVFLRKK